MMSSDQVLDQSDTFFRPKAGDLIRVFNAPPIADRTFCKVLRQLEQHGGASNCADEPWFEIRDPTGAHRCVKGSQMKPRIDFAPTEHWQAVPEDAFLPAGLEIRMNLDGGKFARLMPEGGVGAASHNHNTHGPLLEARASDCMAEDTMMSSDQVLDQSDTFFRPKAGDLIRVFNAPPIADRTFCKVLRQLEQHGGASNCADEPWFEIRDPTGAHRCVKGSQMKPRIDFAPTEHWQAVPEDAFLPAGLEIRMNLDGGKFARLMPEGGVGAASHNHNTHGPLLEARASDCMAEDTLFGGTSPGIGGQGEEVVVLDDSDEEADGDISDVYEVEQLSDGDGAGGASSSNAAAAASSSSAAAGTVGAASGAVGAAAGRSSREQKGPFFVKISAAKIKQRSIVVRMDEAAALGLEGDDAMPDESGLFGADEDENEDVNADDPLDRVADLSLYADLNGDTHDDSDDDTYYDDRPESKPATLAEQALKFRKELDDIMVRRGGGA